MTEHPHPLDPATAGEYLAGREIMAAAGLLADPVRFAYYGLEEPPKDEVLGDRPVPADHRLRAFLLSPPGLSLPERAFYTTLSRAGGLLTHPTLAPLARVPGRAALSSPRRQLELQGVRAELAALHLALGSYSPSEEAARWRLGMAPAPSWLADA